MNLLELFPEREWSKCAADSDQFTYLWATAGWAGMAAASRFILKPDADFSVIAAADSGIKAGSQVVLGNLSEER